jgi:hypothetical protein
VKKLVIDLLIVVVICLAMYAIGYQLGRHGYTEENKQAVIDADAGEGGHFTYNAQAYEIRCATGDAYSVYQVGPANKLDANCPAVPAPVARNTDSELAALGDRLSLAEQKIEYLHAVQNSLLDFIGATEVPTTILDPSDNTPVESVGPIAMGCAYPAVQGFPLCRVSVTAGSN